MVLLGSLLTCSGCNVKGNHAKHNIKRPARNWTCLVENSLPTKWGCQTQVQSVWLPGAVVFPKSVLSPGNQEVEKQNKQNVWPVASLPATSRPGMSKECVWEAPCQLDMGLSQCKRTPFQEPESRFGIPKEAKSATAKVSPRSEWLKRGAKGKTEMPSESFSATNTTP